MGGNQDFIGLPEAQGLERRSDVTPACAQESQALPLQWLSVFQFHLPRDLQEQDRARRANHQHPPSRPKALTHRTMNDIHATILETFFFGYIDRNIGADQTPLFTRTHESEPLSDVIARRFQLTQDEAEAAIEAARQEVATASEAEKWFASHPTDSRKKEISEWIKTCRNPPAWRYSFTGMRIGAPLSLTRKTRNFAGFVSLAFFPTR